MEADLPCDFLAEAAAAQVDALDGFAMVCSYVRNWSGRTSDKYYTPAMVLGLAEEEEEQTPEEAMAAMGRAAPVVEV